MMTDADAKPHDEQSGAVKELIEIVKTVGYALLIALVLRVLLFQPFTIPSASMVPTLLEGDYIIVSKFSYGYSKASVPFSPSFLHGRLFAAKPRRGDVVVFKLPRDGHTDYIKRLIGLPGDRVQVKAGQVFINGQAIPREPMAAAIEESSYGFSIPVERYRETMDNGRKYVTNDYGPGGAIEGTPYDVDNTQVYIVPEGNYFFMGDNRDNSLDSRFPKEAGVGFVPAENLVGKAQIVLLSWKKTASLFKPWTWFLDARPGRFFNIIH